MKKIWIAVLMFTLPLVFALRVNAQAVSSEPSKAEIKKLADTVPLEKMDKYGVPVKEPKFSISMGLGSGYNLGIKIKGVGALKSYNNGFSFSARLGYLPCKYVEIQGEYENVSEFKKVFTTSRLSDWKEITTIGFSVYAINLKLLIPLEIKGINFSPYFIGGRGRAKTKYFHNWGYSDEERFYNNTRLNGSGNYSKIGGGIDVKIYNNLLFITELNYQKVRWEEKKREFYFSQAIGGLSYKF